MRLALGDVYNGQTGHWDFSGADGSPAAQWIPDPVQGPPVSLEDAFSRYNQSNFDFNSAAGMTRLLAAPLGLSEQQLIDAVPVFGNYHRSAFSSGYTEGSNYVKIAVQAVADALTAAGGNGAAYVNANAQNIVNGAAQAQARWKATQEADGNGVFGALMQIAAIAAAIYTGGASLGLWNPVVLTTFAGVSITPSIAVSLANVGLTVASGGDPTSALISLGTQVAGPFAGGDLVSDNYVGDFALQSDVHLVADNYVGDFATDFDPTGDVSYAASDGGGGDYGAGSGSVVTDVQDTVYDDYTADGIEKVQAIGKQYGVNVSAEDALKMFRAPTASWQSITDELRQTGAYLATGIERVQDIGGQYGLRISDADALKMFRAPDASWQSITDELRESAIRSGAMPVAKAVQSGYLTVESAINQGLITPGDAVAQKLLDVGQAIADGDISAGEAVARGFIKAEDAVREGYISAADAIKQGLMPAAAAIAVATAAGASSAEIAAAQAVAGIAAPAATAATAAAPAGSGVTAGQAVTGATAGAGLLTKILNAAAAGSGNQPAAQPARNAQGQVLDAYGNPITGNPLLVNSGVDGVLANLSPMVQQLAVPAVIVGAAYLLTRKSGHEKHSEAKT